MRLLAAALLASILLAPIAEAQTMASPIRGAYADIYLVAGRLLDAEGDAMPNARVIIEVDQAGVTAAPFSATANCKGDFIAYFNIRHVDPAGKLKLTLVAPPGMQNVTETVPLDPFFRRSDVDLRLGGGWDARCGPDEDVLSSSVTIKARVLNRTDEYLVGSEPFFAVPSGSVVTLRYTEASGRVICPPLPNGPPNACELFQPDERGDVAYTFTFTEPFTPDGYATLILDNRTSYNATVDPVTRVALFHIEATGQGVPDLKREAPAAAPAALVLAVAAAALFARARKR